MANDESIPINSLHHYIYCKRRWALIYMEGLWQDNHKTVEGNIVHSLVDDPFFNETRKDTRISRSVPVYFDELPIHGICDCVEFKKNKITVIECKNGEPDKNGVVHKHDGIQLAAQMMCVNNMFNTQCEGYIYYNKIKRRISLTGEEQYFSEIRILVGQMQELLKAKIIQHKEPKQNCRNCSMTDICMPKTDIRSTARNRINNAWETNKG